MWLSLLLLFAVGFGVMQQMAASNTIIRTLLRPIDIELGILPEIAAGLGTASDLQSPPEN
jgi:hypothetical protein